MLLGVQHRRVGLVSQVACGVHRGRHRQWPGNHLRWLDAARCEQPRLVAVRLQLVQLRTQARGELLDPGQVFEVVQRVGQRPCSPPNLLGKSLHSDGEIGPRQLDRPPDQQQDVPLDQLPFGTAARGVMQLRSQRLRGLLDLAGQCPDFGGGVLRRPRQHLLDQPVDEPLDPDPPGTADTGPRECLDQRLPGPHHLLGTCLRGGGQLHRVLPPGRCHLNVCVEQRPRSVDGGLRPGWNRPEHRLDVRCGQYVSDGLVDLTLVVSRRHPLTRTRPEHQLQAVDQSVEDVQRRDGGTVGSLPLRLPVRRGACFVQRRDRIHHRVAALRRHAPGQPGQAFLEIYEHLGQSVHRGPSLSHPRLVGGLLVTTAALIRLVELDERQVVPPRPLGRHDRRPQLAEVFHWLHLAGRPVSPPLRLAVRAGGDDEALPEPPGRSGSARECPGDTASSRGPGSGRRPAHRSPAPAPSPRPHPAPGRPPALFAPGDRRRSPRRSAGQR